MIELFEMWAVVEILGLLCLPLTVTIFHNLPDRGWAFSKAIGVAMLAFCVWLPLMGFHALFFSQGFIAGVLLLLAAGNVVGFLRVRQTIIKLVRVNLIYILITEVVFLGMVFILGWIRSYDPAIRGFEMFMDEGILQAIVRSPHLPPNDVWLSGYPINYYYYAQYTIAVLAKFLGQSPTIAFNTGICVCFGLTATNLFGVTSNIVAWARYRRPTEGAQLITPVVSQFIAPSTETASDLSHVEAQSIAPPSHENTTRPDTTYPPLLSAAPYGLLTMLVGLVLGNLAATQEWWQNHDLGTFDWFAPSRVVNNTINEFPAFSFLLSCFHAHVLTLSFTILAIALALNLFLTPGGEGSREGKGLGVFGSGSGPGRLPITLGVTAMILGGLFVMNGWDLPTYLGLALICIALQQWLVHQSRFSLELVIDVLTAGAALTILSLLLYAPFYLTFVSPAQGIGFVTNPAERSPLGGEMLIYGLFGLVFLSLLLASVSSRQFFSSSSRGRDTQVEANATRSSAERLWLKSSAIALFVSIGAILVISVIIQNAATFAVAGSIAALGAVIMCTRFRRDRGQAFTLLLGSIAFALVALCEVVYLKDVFAGGDYLRMNTVFKLYFQAWALLSITTGAGMYFILQSFRPAVSASLLQWRVQLSVEVLWVAGVLVLLLAGLVYPIAGTYARTNHYAQRSNSLDGLTYLQSYNASDYAAIEWLNSHISGDPIIVEAIGADGGDYSDSTQGYGHGYGRVSVYTGLPTLMGWQGHEYQWRVNWLNNPANALDYDPRVSAVDTIYTDPDASVVLTTLARYHVEYLYVGPLEQAKYLTVNLGRFSAFMQVVYRANGVTIYRVP